MDHVHPPASVAVELRRTQDEEKRYQIAKDLSDNLTISYNTSEVIMARLMQTTSAKERVYSQAVAFFSTNDSVLTALKASFTGMFGLHESTKTLDAMKEGMSKSLEDLAKIGDKVQEAAIRSGYGPTIRADAVKQLIDSVVTFQERSGEIIAGSAATITAWSMVGPDDVRLRLIAKGDLVPLFTWTMVVQSVAAAVQNLLLGAHALGLGAVWMGYPNLAGPAIQRWLGAEGELMATIALGYPAEKPGAGRRQPVAAVTRWER